MISAQHTHNAVTTPSQGRKPLVGAAAARGMTLIELLVTIVILVTVLAAALPAISPNNDARKIREASRQLTSLFAQAQAQAARDGRPIGVGFDDPDGDGIALEAYLVTSPAPFPGLATYSKARLRFNGGDVTAVQFVDGPYSIPDPSVDPDNCYQLDPLPPNLVRLGDVVNVNGFRFELIDEDLDGDGTDETNPRPQPGDLYTHTTPRALFRCKLTQPRSMAPRAYLDFKPPQNDVPRTGWANPQRYSIERRAGTPKTSTAASRSSRTAAATLQFPRGVGIDLFVSGLEPQLSPQNLTVPEPIYEYGFTTMISPRRTALTATNPLTPTPMDPSSMTVAIMISPTGQFAGAYVNGEYFGGNFSHIHLLMGRSENGSVDPTNSDDLDFSSASVPTGADGDDIVRERREAYNWLNADSRWVNIDASSGRVVASDVAVPDPRLLQAAQDGDPVTMQIPQQIEASRAFAEQMETEGGR